MSPLQDNRQKVTGGLTKWHNEDLFKNNYVL